MARQIKFRAKTLDTNAWVYGDIITKKPTMRFLSDCVIFDGTWHSVNPKTIGQYTGRDDRNGTPIYEGDIVDLYDDECGLCGSRLEVAFSDDEARFAYTNRVPGHEYTMGFDKRWRDNIYVVIGNIHDNPEILNHDANDTDKR